MGHLGDRLRCIGCAHIGCEALHQRLVMLLPRERQQRLDASVGAGDHIGLTEEAVVRDQRVHLAQQRWQRLDLLQRRHDFVLIVARLADVRGDHHHRLGVHPGLCVVALLKAAARTLFPILSGIVTYIQTNTTADGR